MLWKGNTNATFYTRPSFKLFNEIVNLTKSSQINLNLAFNGDFIRILLTASDVEQLADTEITSGTS